MEGESSNETRWDVKDEIACYWIRQSSSYLEAGPGVKYVKWSFQLFVSTEYGMWEVLYERWQALWVQEAIFFISYIFHVSLFEHFLIFSHLNLF